MLLCFSALFALTPGVQATGSVTFQVEVLEGFSISSPATLTFAPVGPGQSDVQDVELTVWSNVAWDLSVKAVGYDPEEGLPGTVEVGASGDWYLLSSETSVIQMSRLPTGAGGAMVSTPFRLQGSYNDAPGSYSFQVQFTVSAAI